MRCFIITATLLLITSLSISAQNRKDEKSKIFTDTVTVWGNCGMCEETIEGAIKKLNGIEKASWDMKLDLLTVSYDSSEIDLLTIQQKIAEKGYDTRDVKATDEKYKSLHQCCQYERPKQ